MSNDELKVQRLKFNRDNIDEASEVQETPKAQKSDEVLFPDGKSSPDAFKTNNTPSAPKASDTPVLFGENKTQLQNKKSSKTQDNVPLFRFEETESYDKSPKTNLHKENNRKLREAIAKKDKMIEERLGTALHDAVQKGFQGATSYQFDTFGAFNFANANAYLKDTDNPDIIRGNAAEEMSRNGISRVKAAAQNVQSKKAKQLMQTGDAAGNFLKEQGALSATTQVFIEFFGGTSAEELNEVLNIELKDVLELQKLAKNINDFDSLTTFMQKYKEATGVDFSTEKVDKFNVAKFRFEIASAAQVSQKISDELQKEQELKDWQKEYMSLGNLEKTDKQKYDTLYKAHLKSNLTPLEKALMKKFNNNRELCLEWIKNKSEKYNIKGKAAGNDYKKLVQEFVHEAEELNVAILKNKDFKTIQNEYKNAFENLMGKSIAERKLNEYIENQANAKNIMNMSVLIGASMLTGGSALAVAGTFGTMSALEEATDNDGLTNNDLRDIIKDSALTYGSFKLFNIVAGKVTPATYKTLCTQFGISPEKAIQAAKLTGASSAGFTTGTTMKFATGITSGENITDAMQEAIKTGIYGGVIAAGFSLVGDAVGSAKAKISKTKYEKISYEQQSKYDYENLLKTLKHTQKDNPDFKVLMNSIKGDELSPHSIDRVLDFMRKLYDGVFFSPKDISTIEMKTTDLKPTKSTDIMLQGTPDTTTQAGKVSTQKAFMYKYSSPNYTDGTLLTLDEQATLGAYCRFRNSTMRFLEAQSKAIIEVQDPALPNNAQANTAQPLALTARKNPALEGFNKVCPGLKQTALIPPKEQLSTTIKTKTEIKARIAEFRPDVDMAALEKCTLEQLQNIEKLALSSRDGQYTFKANEVKSFGLSQSTETIESMVNCSTAPKGPKVTKTPPALQTETTPATSAEKTVKKNTFGTLTHSGSSQKRENSAPKTLKTEALAGLPKTRIKTRAKEIKIEIMPETKPEETSLTLQNTKISKGNTAANLKQPADLETMLRDFWARSYNTGVKLANDIAPFFNVYGAQIPAVPTAIAQLVAEKSAAATLPLAAKISSSDEQPDETAKLLREAKKTKREIDALLDKSDKTYDRPLTKEEIKANREKISSILKDVDLGIDESGFSLDDDFGIINDLAKMKDGVERAEFLKQSYDEMDSSFHFAFSYAAESITDMSAEEYEQFTKLYNYADKLSSSVAEKSKNINIKLLTDIIQSPIAREKAMWLTGENQGEMPKEAQLLKEILEEYKCEEWDKNTFFADLTTLEKIQELSQFKTRRDKTETHAIDFRYAYLIAQKENGLDVAKKYYNLFKNSKHISGGGYHVLNLLNIPDILDRLDKITEIVKENGGLSIDLFDLDDILTEYYENFINVYNTAKADGIKSFDIEGALNLLKMFRGEPEKIIPAIDLYESNMKDGIPEVSFDYCARILSIVPQDDIEYLNNAIYLAKLKNDGKELFHTYDFDDIIKRKDICARTVELIKDIGVERYDSPYSWEEILSSPEMFERAKQLLALKDGENFIFRYAYELKSIVKDAERYNRTLELLKVRDENGNTFFDKHAIEYITKNENSYKFVLRLLELKDENGKRIYDKELFSYFSYSNANTELERLQELVDKNIIINSGDTKLNSALLRSIICNTEIWEKFQAFADKNMDSLLKAAFALAEFSPEEADVLMNYANSSGNMLVSEKELAIILLKFSAFQLGKDSIDNCLKYTLDYISKNPQEKEFIAQNADTVIMAGIDTAKKMVQYPFLLNEQGVIDITAGAAIPASIKFYIMSHIDTLKNPTPEKIKEMNDYFSANFDFSALDTLKAANLKPEITQKLLHYSNSDTLPLKIKLVQELYEKNTFPESFIKIIIKDGYETMLEKVEYYTKKPEEISFITNNYLSRAGFKLKYFETFTPAEELQKAEEIVNEQLKKCLTHPELYISGEAENPKEIVEEFFRGHPAIVAAHVLGPEALDDIMRYRFDDAEEYLEDLLTLSYKNKMLLKRMANSLNQNGKPFNSVDKVSMLYILNAYRKLGNPISAIEEMLDNNSLNLKELNTKVFTSLLKVSGVPSEKIAQLPEEKFLEWDMKYVHLLAAQMRGDSENIFRDMILSAINGNFIEYITSASNKYGEINAQTQKMFEEKGMNYSAWLTPDSTCNVTFKSLDANQEKLHQIAEQIVEDIETLRATPAKAVIDKTFKKFIKEDKFFIPTNIEMHKEKLANLVKDLLTQLNKLWKRAEVNVNSPDTLQAQNANNALMIKGHLEQRQQDIAQSKKAAESEVQKSLNWTIKMWDRVPQKDIFQGNYSTCCIGMNGGNGHAMPNYLMNTMFNMIEVKDNVTGNVVGNALCYFAENDSGEPVFVVDNIEIRNSAKPSEQVGKNLRTAIAQYARNITSQVTGKPDTPIYLGTHYNDVPSGDLDTTKTTLTMLGKMTCDDIYVDMFGGWEPIKPKEVECYDFARGLKPQFTKAEQPAVEQQKSDTTDKVKSENAKKKITPPFPLPEKIWTPADIMEAKEMLMNSQDAALLARGINEGIISETLLSCYNFDSLENRIKTYDYKVANGIYNNKNLDISDVPRDISPADAAKKALTLDLSDENYTNGKLEKKFADLFAENTFARLETFSKLPFEVQRIITTNIYTSSLSTLKILLDTISPETIKNTDDYYENIISVENNLRFEEIKEYFAKNCMPRGTAPKVSGDFSTKKVNSAPVQDEDSIMVLMDAKNLERVYIHDVENHREFHFIINENGEKELVLPYDIGEYLHSTSSADNALEKSTFIGYASGDGKVYDHEGNPLRIETLKQKAQRLGSNLLLNRSQMHAIRSVQVNRDGARIISKILRTTQDFDEIVSRYKQALFGEREISAETQEILEAKVRFTLKNMRLVDAELSRVKPNAFPRTYWRGLRLSVGDAKVLLDAKEGDVVVPDAGYAFATRDKHFATSYLASKDDIMLEVHTPVGVQVSKLPNNQNQVLFKRNVKYKVIGRYKDEFNRNVIKLKMLLDYEDAPIPDDNSAKKHF